MNRFVISDIHGCFLTFSELLNKVGLSKSDELYLLGDYIDRGSKSKEVVDFIIDLQNQDFNIKTLKGNHEEMIFDSIELENWAGGAEETLQSFEIQHFKELDKIYIDWFSKLQSYFNTDEYIYVHAGLNFENKNPLQDKQSMCWIGNWYEKIDYNWLGNKKIIHGHKPKRKLEINKMIDNFEVSKILNIDNGCFMKNQVGYGNLCCVELDKMELTFQENID